MANDLFGFLTGNRGVPRKKKRSTVKHDALDDGVLQDVSDKAELYKKAREDKPTFEVDGKSHEVDSWGTIVDDTFRLLHTNTDPGVEAAEDILPSLEPVRRIHQRFVSTEEFKSTKPMTTHDQIASAFGAMRARERLSTLAEGEMKSMFEDAREAEKAENRIERNETKLEDLREQARKMHQDQGEVSKEVKDQIGEAVNRKTNARHDLAKIQQNMQNTPVNVGASQIIQQAAKDAKEAAEVVHSLPGMGKGQKQQMNADEALRLANLFAENPTLFEIARKLGRIIRDMRFKRARRMEGGVEEIVGLELGSDLSEVLPDELMMLRHPVLKRLFYLNYSQDALLQRERMGTTEAGRGPLVAVVDESSSMSWGGENQRFVWAKALCMAIIAIARKEKRDAAVVSFSSAGQTETWSFPWKERMDAGAVVDMAGHNFGGGTRINDGVQAAEQVIAKDDRYHRADLVLITDGEDYEGWSDETQKIMADLEAKAVRLHGIQVGGQPSDYLENACESVASAMDLVGANAATDMLAANIN